MDTVGQRLRMLRNSIKVSQEKMGELVGVKQSSINRYETDNAEAPYRVLIAYADCFDVSMDYIFGRTDKPQGELYEHKPKVVDSKDWEKFVEMCFDPASPVNARLKDMLLDMMGGGAED